MARPSRLLLLAALLAPLPARAEVVSVGPSGFVVHGTAIIERPAAEAWRRLVRIGAWWSPEHSYSRDAANLTLTPTPGGCFCETLPGGGVVHMTVVYAAPGKALRLVGGLGPLQGMGLSGALTFTLKPAGEHRTEVTLEYAVGGYAPGGFAEIAAAVDGVLGEQLARYAGH